MEILGITQTLINPGYSRFYQHAESQNFPHTHSGSVDKNKFNQLNRLIFGILPMTKYGTFHMVPPCRVSVRAEL